MTDLTVYGRDLVASVETAGGDVSGDTTRYLAALVMNTRYTPGPDGAAPVTAPEPGLVVTADEMDADRGC